MKSYRRQKRRLQKVKRGRRDRIIPVPKRSIVACDGCARSVVRMGRKRLELRIMRTNLELAFFALRDRRHTCATQGAGA